MILWSVPTGTWPWSSRPQQEFLCPAPAESPQLQGIIWFLSVGSSVAATVEPTLRLPP